MSRSLAALRHLCDQYAQVAFPDSHEIDAMSHRYDQTVRLMFLPTSRVR